MDLENQFHKEMVRIYREATKFGYYPNYFLQMVANDGGLSAAKRLLNSGDTSSGLSVSGWNSDLICRSKRWFFKSRGAVCSQTQNWT